MSDNLISLITSDLDAKRATAGGTDKRAIPVSEYEPTKTRPSPGRNIPGLVLRVSQTGHKSWSIQFRRQSDGKLRRLTLGEYPDVSLADARQRARDARGEVSTGADPAKAKQTRRAADTFADLSDAWLLHLEGKGRAKTYVTKSRGTLAVHVLPTIGDAKANEVTKKDVLHLLDAMVAKGLTHQPNRALSALRACYRWATSEDRVTVDPTAGVKPRRDEVARDRIMTRAELQRFWTGIDGAKGVTEAIKITVKLALLTGQRIGEVARIKISDIDAGLWTIPASNAKNGTLHTVPLSPQALALIGRAMVLSGAKRVQSADGTEGAPQWLFPSPDGRTHIDTHAPTRAWDRVRSSLRLGDIRIHDLRRTCASGLAELGFGPDIIGKVLNHTSTAKSGVTSAVYIRHGFTAEKRRALEAWAAHVDRIAAGDTGETTNVVTLESARKSA
jgi:integrase